MDDKKVIVIAGASSGTGKAMAEYLGRKGHLISICARRHNLIRQIADSINSSGGKAYGMKVDMTVWEEAREFVDKTVEEFGRVDVMINNVGWGVRFADFDDLSIEEINQGVAVNLTSVLYGCKAVLPVMKKQKSGYIINVTSILGIRARAGLSVYTAGKHGVDGFSRALFNEVKKYGIRVSILGPAMINTEWAEKAGIKIPFSRGKMIEPEDIARIIDLMIQTSDHYALWSVDCMALEQTIDPL